MLLIAKGFVDESGVWPKDELLSVCGGLLASFASVVFEIVTFEFFQNHLREFR